LVIEASAQNPAFAELAHAAIHAKRCGTASEAAAATVWFCSDQSSYLFGQLLVFHDGVSIGGFEL
jgi:NAD(P)-dependent dehydrogenase (short-subunit alcohol dehydrogenase family)